MTICCRSELADDSGGEVQSLSANIGRDGGLNNAINHPASATVRCRLSFAGDREQPCTLIYS